MNILTRFKDCRKRTLTLCENLEEADYNLQPIEDVSPAKWHLAHTTWFFETFILKNYFSDYQVFNDDFSFFFNSYYEHVGKRTARHKRGDMSRPLLKEVLEYRDWVNQKMEEILTNSNEEIEELTELGCQHEEQHQELLITDIKYSLSLNPLYPKVGEALLSKENLAKNHWLEFKEGINEIGFKGNGFSFDNESPRHRVFLESFKITKNVVSVGEYLEFIEDGGYQDFRHWLSEGWMWICKHQISSPLYWEKKNNIWQTYTLAGLKAVNKNEPISHISYFEADAFARWKGYRLPTEQEWEMAHNKLNYGQVWEWTQSAYLPYPGYKAEEGALGEYNGKWMINQMVLRGGSVATAPNHSRPTYRNFFHADKRWQFTGIRLAENI